MKQERVEYYISITSLVRDSEARGKFLWGWMGLFNVKDSDQCRNITDTHQHT